MANWLDALQKIIEGTPDLAADVASRLGPGGLLVRPLADRAPSPLEALDYPLEHVGMPTAGYLFYQNARLNKLLGQNEAAAQKRIDAYRQGYNGWEPGGRAVWEAAIGEQPAVLNALMTAGVDPLNIVGLPWQVKGVSKLAGFGADLAAHGGSAATASGRAIQAAGIGLHGAERALNYPGELVYAGLAKGLKGTAGRAISHFGLDELAPRFSLQKKMNETAASAGQLWRNRRAQMSGFVAPPAPSTQGLPKTPWLPAPIYRSPLFREEAAREDAAWAALKSKFPKVSDAATGYTITDRNELMLEPEDIVNFAEVAAGILRSSDVNQDPTVSYRGLRWVSTEFEKARRAIVAANPGLENLPRHELEMMYPAVFEQIWRANPDLPQANAIYSTRRGFIEGGDAITQAMGEGPINPKTGKIVKRTEPLWGTQAEPGVGRHAEAAGAATINLSREGGDSSSFEIGGDLYNVIRKTGQIEPHPEFVRLLEDAKATHPSGLRFGTTLPDGTFVTAKELVRQKLDAEFGIPLAKEEFERVWAGATQLAYEGQLKAAQAVDVPVANAAKEYARQALDRETGEVFSPSAGDVEARVRYRMNNKTGEVLRFIGKEEIKPTDPRYAQATPLPANDDVKVKGVTGQKDSIAAAFERNPNEWEDPKYPINQSWAGHGMLDFDRITTTAPSQAKRANDLRVFTENEQRMLMPNTTWLVHAILNGAELAVQGQPAKEWYARTIRELYNVVGEGNINDAVFLLDLIAATSAQTGPFENADQALKALILYKAGHDEAFMELTGITREELDSLPKLVEWGKMGPDIPEPLQTPLGNKTKTIDQAVARHEGVSDELPGGPKYGDYGGQFEVEARLDALRARYSTPDGGVSPFGEELIGAVKRAIAEHVVDRHQGRLFGLGSAPSPMEYLLGRFMGRMATEQAAAQSGKELLSHEGQAGGWFWSKGLQGFARRASEDDIATSIVKILDDLGVNELPSDERMAALVRETINRVADNEVKSSIFGPEWVDRGVQLPEGPIRANDASAIARGIRQELETTNNLVPGTFRIEGRGPNARLVDHSPSSGYGVAVAGTPLMDPTDPAAVERAVRQMIHKFAPLLDAPDSPFHLGKYVSDSGKVSVDLTLVVNDRAQAEALGIAAHQESIADFAGITKAIETDNWDDAFIMTGGDGNSPYTTVKQVAELQQKVRLGLTTAVKEVLESPEAADRLIASPGLRGMSETFLGADYGPYIQSKLQPVVDVTDRLVTRLRPFLEDFGGALEAASKPVARAADDKVVPVPKATTGDPLDREGLLFPERIPEGARARPAPYDPLLSAADNKQLYDNYLSDGRSYGEALEGFRLEAAQDGDALRAANVKYSITAPPQNLDDLLKGKQGVLRLIRKWEKIGMDPMRVDPEQIALDRFEEELGKELGVKPIERTKYRLFRQAWGEQALFSPRFHLSNLLGAWIANIADGGGITANPKQYWAGLMAASGKNAHRIDPSLLKGAESAHRWGLDELSLRKIRQTHPRLGMDDSERGFSAIGHIAEKIGGKKVGKVIGAPFRKSGTLMAGIEISVRDAVFADVLDAEMEKGLPTFFAEVREMARRQALDDFTMPNLMGFEGRMTPISIKQKLIDSGFSEGYAERAGRNYAELAGASRDKAFATIDRRHFSYEKTKLDEAISQVVPFHYWMSRATRFYAEIALTHPLLIAQYARMREGLDDLYNEPGGDARIKGFLKLMDGPTGFALLMNPDSLVGVIKAFELDTGFTPDGETRLGQIIRVGKSRGIGLFPWIEAIFNYAGAEGDTFEPDPLGLRHRALVGAAIQAARAHGLLPGEGPTDAPYASMQSSIRAGVSKWVADWLPGAAYVPSKASADGTQGRATLDTLIASRVMESNPNLTNEQMLAILADPDSPEYQAAYRSAAQAGLLNQLMSITLPATTRLKDNARDVRTRATDTIRAAAEEKGVPPEQYRPGLGDAEFRATYENMTGKSFKPGDFSKAALQRELASTLPEARPLVIQKHEYEALGTDEGQVLLDKWEKITRGEWAPPDAPQVIAPEYRQMVADAWLSRQPGSEKVADIRNQRRAYLETHPELQEFKTWQSMMFNLKDMYGPYGFAKYRQEVTKQNPNFAAYIKEQVRLIKKRNPTMSEEELTSELDGMTVSVGAWFAATGRAKSPYDTPQSAGSLPFDPATQAISAQAAMQGPPPTYNPMQQQSWVDVLHNYR